MAREPMRRAAAEAVVARFMEDPRVAIVLAEISTDLFEPAFRHDPRRAVNVGIMEQAMVGVAAGFALEGFRPVAHTIAPFLAERAHEQVKLDFGYQGLGGLFVSTGASYDYAHSGMTHHAPGDVATLATVPGMRILVPGAAAEAGVLADDALRRGDLAYLRTTAAENERVRVLDRAGLTLVRRGADLTVIAVGPMLDRTLTALDGLDATVLYATTVVPLDGETVARESAPAAEVVVVEPFYEGTLAAQVAAALSHRPIRLESIGVPRRVLHRYGTRRQHDLDLGLDAHGITQRIRAFLAAGHARRAA